MALRNARKEAALSLEALRASLHYDPLTGLFSRLDGWRSGPVAGSVLNTGYRVIRVGVGRFLAHRLAWFYTHGEWPTEIDHINQNRDDNRIANLRVVSRKENCWNSGAHSDRSFFLKNICRARGSVRVDIYRNGKSVFRKQYPCFGQAVKARNIMLNQLSGG